MGMLEIYLDLVRQLKEILRISLSVEQLLQDRLNKLDRVRLCGRLSRPHNHHPSFSYRGDARTV